ncbi:MAG TPA: hypothetical protein DHW73_09350 [Pseudomonas sp.]|nr:hypothetical protein [Pseudomonadales bacterium]HCB41805.1 hypothetical protein [Pseudomonas sp.]HCL41565.1 hypothetical protein [Pseudomonas sp.]|tara:strand:+ start:425 stop:850 length:426 start_codon:yes stop_codon:yes gene_type:complete
MLQPVIQEQTTGCGIASAAVLLGCSYAQMKATANAMGIFAEDTALWSDTQYVRRLLATGNLVVSATEEPFVSWQALPDLALLAIKHHWEGDRPFWHWVVFERAGADMRVLDSASYLPANVRTDFAVMQPAWFIEVSAAQAG